MGVTSNKRAGFIEVLVISDSIRQDGIAYLKDPYPPNNPLLPYARHSETCAVRVEEYRWIAAGSQGEMKRADCNCDLDLIAGKIANDQKNHGRVREISCAIVPEDVAERISSPKSARALMLRLGMLTKYQQSKIVLLIYLVRALRSGKRTDIEAYAELKAQANFPENREVWPNMKDVITAGLCSAPTHYLKLKDEKKDTKSIKFNFSKLAGEMRDHLEVNPMMVAWKHGESGVRFALLCRDLYEGIVARISMDLSIGTKIKRCAICDKILPNNKQQITCGGRCRVQLWRSKRAAA